MRTRSAGPGSCVAVLFSMLVGCRAENEAPNASTAASAATSPVTGGDTAGTADHGPPVVDMRGCMVLPAAREKADAIERARADCPTKLHDETRRESGKDVTWGFVLNQGRTDDVRARAVPNTCCYDKRHLSSR